MWFGYFLTIIWYSRKNELRVTLALNSNIIVYFTWTIIFRTISSVILTLISYNQLDESRF